MSIYSSSFCGALFLGLALVGGGCASAQQKTAPGMEFGILSMQTQFTRDDVVVLDTVKGESSATKILFGAVEIVDGNKYAILGIKFFEDKMSGIPKRKIEWPFILNTISVFLGPTNSVEQRARYKALEQHADADAVFDKSVDYSDTGLPGLWETVDVTVSGKAVKLKSDK